MEVDEAPNALQIPLVVVPSRSTFLQTRRCLHLQLPDSNRNIPTLPQSLTLEQLEAHASTLWKTLMAVTYSNQGVALHLLRTLRSFSNGEKIFTETIEVLMQYLGVSKSKKRRCEQM